MKYLEPRVTGFWRNKKKTKHNNLQKAFKKITFIVSVSLLVAAEYNCVWVSQFRDRLEQRFNWLHMEQTSQYVAAPL